MGPLSSLKGAAAHIHKLCPTSRSQAPLSRGLHAAPAVLLVISPLSWLPTGLAGKTGSDSSREHVRCQGLPATARQEEAEKRQQADQAWSSPTRDPRDGQGRPRSTFRRHLPSPCRPGTARILEGPVTLERGRAIAVWAQGPLVDFHLF